MSYFCFFSVISPLFDIRLLHLVFFDTKFAIEHQKYVVQNSQLNHILAIRIDIFTKRTTPMYSLRHIFMLLPIFALCPLFSSAEIVIVADTESSHEISEISSLSFDGDFSSGTLTTTFSTN